MTISLPEQRFEVIGQTFIDGGGASDQSLEKTLGPISVRQIFTVRAENVHLAVVAYVVALKSGMCRSTSTMPNLVISFDFVRPGAFDASEVRPSWYDTITRLRGPRRREGPIKRLNFRSAVVRTGMREAMANISMPNASKGLTRSRHTALYTLRNG